ncbi:MAG: NAD(P)-dependent oxidoreductase [Spirochaetia bacterium]|nr:NAD(P)-dependent oxidoreductase [Spirochaetia bacterium]
MNNMQVKHDIEEIIQNTNILQPFNGSSIFVSGSTGLIGSMFIRTVLTSNIQNKTDITIIAHCRNSEKAKKQFSDFLNDKHLVFCVGDITSPITYEGNVEYIVHGASSTSSKFFVNSPVETIGTTLQGTKNVLDFARKKSVKKIVFLSSLEVYGIPNKIAVTEQDAGYLDWTKIRSSYSESKRMAECLSLAFYSEYKVPAVIVRLGQIIGSGFDDSDQRVFAQFIRAAVQGQSIVLKTKGDSLRDYCYITDVIEGLLLILCKGQPGEIYNLANEATTCSIADVAQEIVDLSENKFCKRIFDLSESAEKLGYNPTMKIQLKSDKLRELGWVPKVSLQEAIKRMIVYYRIQRNNK